MVLLANSVKIRLAVILDATITSSTSPAILLQDSSKPVRKNSRKNRAKRDAKGDKTDKSDASDKSEEATSGASEEQTTPSGPSNITTTTDSVAHMVRTPSLEALHSETTNALLNEFDVVINALSDHSQEIIMKFITMMQERGVQYFQNLLVSGG